MDSNEIIKTYEDEFKILNHGIQADIKIGVNGDIILDAIKKEGDIIPTEELEQYKVSCDFENLLQTIINDKRVKDFQTSDIIQIDGDIVRATMSFTLSVGQTIQGKEITISFHDIPYYPCVGGLEQTIKEFSEIEKIDYLSQLDIQEEISLSDGQLIFDIQFNLSDFVDKIISAAKVVSLQNGLSFIDKLTGSYPTAISCRAAMPSDTDTVSSEYTTSRDFVLIYNNKEYFSDLSQESISNIIYHSNEIDIEEIVIPFGINMLNKFLFKDCNNLKQIFLPATVNINKISPYAFAMAPENVEIHFNNYDTCFLHMPKGAIITADNYSIQEIKSNLCFETDIDEDIMNEICRIGFAPFDEYINSHALKVCQYIAIDYYEKVSYSDTIPAGLLDKLAEMPVYYHRDKIYAYVESLMKEYNVCCFDR